MSFFVIVLTLESVFIFELPDIFRDIKKKRICSFIELIMNDPNSLYYRFYDAYKKAYSEKKSKQVIQQEVNALWANLKRSTNFEKAVAEETTKLNLVVTAKKANFLSYFSASTLKVDTSFPVPKSYKKERQTQPRRNKRSVEPSNNQVNNYSFETL